MTQIPFFLVTGFLGSGKTTFLKSALEKLPKKKVAIIQNEFAPASIDGTELKRQDGNYKTLEINNGSVFCVCLLNDFIGSLVAFVDKYRPDMVFLEASGLSDPIAIAQMLDFKDLRKRIFLSRIWTIIDSSKFFQQTGLIKRIEHQVRVADTLIINKTDLTEKNEINRVKKRLTQLNPFAEIVESRFCDIPNFSFDEISGIEPVAIKTKEKNVQFESCERPDIGVGVLKTTKSISRDKLKQFIEYHSKKTIRIKGFAKLSNHQFVSIQSSYDQFELKEIDYFDGPTEIIAMGEGFNLSEFSREYRALSKL
jgi:G3E family GTPase